MPLVCKTRFHLLGTTEAEDGAHCRIAKYFLFKDLINPSPVLPAGRVVWEITVFQSIKRLAHEERRLVSFPGHRPFDKLRDREKEPAQGSEKESPIGAGHDEDKGSEKE